MKLASFVQSSKHDLSHPKCRELLLLCQMFMVTNRSHLRPNPAENFDFDDAQINNETNR